MNEEKKDDKDKMLGYLGECYIRLELAKRGIYSQRMHKDFLNDYDLILNNGLKIEVKCSSILIHKDKRRQKGQYQRKVWAFNNYKRGAGGKMISGRLRDCDFFILLCFDENKKPLKYYIVPANVIQDRWDLITGDLND